MVEETVYVGSGRLLLATGFQILKVATVTFDGIGLGVPYPPKLRAEYVPVVSKRLKYFPDAAQSILSDNISAISYQK